MPAERTAMRQVREVLRLKFVGGVPTREIARRIGVAAAEVALASDSALYRGSADATPERLRLATEEAPLLIATGLTVMTTPQIAEWTHPGGTSRRDAYRYLRDALERYCVRVGRDVGGGRPLLWRLRNSGD